MHVNFTFFNSYLPRGNKRAKSIKILGKFKRSLCQKKIKNLISRYETGGEEGKWNKMMMCLLLLLWFGDIISGVTFLFLLASVKTNAAAELSQGRVAAATGLAGKKTKK